MKLRDANLQVYEKNPFTCSPSCVVPPFSKNASRLLLPKRLWKCACKVSFRKYNQRVVLVAIYLSNYDSPKSTSFMLNAAFDVVLSWVRFLSNKLQFIAIQRWQKHSSFLGLRVLIGIPEKWDPGPWGRTLGWGPKVEP